MFENINTGLDGLTTSFKEQASFNKRVMSQIDQLASAAKFADGVENVSSVTTRGGKTTRDPPNPNHSTAKTPRQQEQTSAEPIDPQEESSDEEPTPKVYGDTTMLPFPTTPNGRKGKPSWSFLPLQDKVRTRHDKNVEGSQTGPLNGFNGRPRVPESGMTSEGSKTRPASRNHWGCPRQGQKGREESTRREAASCWTLSNETSNPDRVDPALWERLRATADPLEWGTGSHLDYPIGARPGVGDARSTGSTSRPQCEISWSKPKAPLPWRTTSGEGGNQERFHQKRQHNPRRSQRLLQGLGSYPRGGRSRDPTETRPTREPLLERKRSNRDLGDTVEVVNEGYPNRCT